MDQGIPVFTVGVHVSLGHEFTNFAQVPQLEGQTAGKIVLDSMKASSNDLKVFAGSSGGNADGISAQGRMKGFHEAIAEAIPDAKFVATEATTASTSATIPVRPMTPTGRSSLQIRTCSASRMSSIGAEHADPRDRAH